MQKSWNNYTIIFAFLMSLWVGYISFFLPEYVSLFHGHLHKKTEKLAFAVTESCDSLNQICRKVYRLEGISKLLALHQNEVLALGRIWNASRIICDGKTVSTFGDPGNPIGSRDTNNQFVLLDASALSKCNNTFVIEAYYQLGQKKSGLLDGQPYFTSRRSGTAIKRCNEFILQDLKILNLCLILAVVFFNMLIRIVAIDPDSRIRVMMSGLIAASACAQSGLIEVWMPIGQIPLINRWIAAVSYCAFATYGVYYLGGFKRHSKIFFSGAAVVFCVILLISGSRITTWIVFSGLISATYLGAVLFVRRFDTFLTGVFFSLSTLEFLGINGMPNSYCAPLFLALLGVFESHRAFVSYLKINRLLRLSRSKEFNPNQRKQHYYRAQAIIKLFQQQFVIGKVTVVNLVDPDRIQLEQFTKKSALPEMQVLDELTPIFAHLVITGNSLINVHAESDIVVSLRRGDTKHQARSDFFTAIPLFAGREVIGAIALTDYDANQFKSSLNHSTFLFCIDIMKGILVEHLLTAPKSETLSKIARLNEKIGEMRLGKFSEMSEVIDKFGEILHLAFGWRVLSATMAETDYLLKVGKIFDFDKVVSDQIRKGKLYALPDNRQGPLALAVHGKSPYIVARTDWLKGVVHANTKKFFTIHGTRTAAFVPVIGQDNETVVGVYWIEGREGSEIIPSDRELFLALMKIVHERIKLMRSDSHLQQSKESLAQFMPKHLIEEFLAGREVVEKDCGFLLMFDLKGSTNLAHAIGNAAFHHEVELLKNRFVDALKGSLWVLQQHVWDSFDFSYSLPVSHNEKISVTRYLEVFENEFKQWKKELLSYHSSLPEVRALSYRICFTYGDTSRGIVEDGITQKWTFIGNAIAVVSKIEQASKGLKGRVFCDASVVSRSQEKWAEAHTTQQGLVVYELAESDRANETREAA